MIDHGRRSRDRGADSLKDYELIAAILGTGTSGRGVIEIAKEVAGLLNKGNLPQYSDLIRINGVGQSKACVLLACFEIARRYGLSQTEEMIRMTMPSDIFHIQMIKDIQLKKQEYFITITLNGASEVIQSRIITMGLLNQSLIHPREVFSDAVTDRAAGIICAHNHPSGNLDPSSQDIQITRQLASAGEIMGIQLIDHIIFSKSGFLSFKEEGYI